MANLPDLDTLNIGVIGFWNFLDHSTDTSLDPTEVLDHANIETWETYDNGVEGTMRPTIHGHRSWSFRVKADGWFIVYMDRTNVHQQTANAPPTTYVDLIDDWPNGNNAGYPASAFTSDINSLRQQLSNSGTATFNDGDVGHHSYEFPNADTWTQMFENIGSAASFNGGLSYDASATRHYHCVGARTKAGTAASSYCSSDAKFEGLRISFSDEGDGVKFGTRDVLAQNLMPSSNTVYTNTGGTNNNSNGQITHCIFAQV